MRNSEQESEHPLMKFVGKWKKDDLLPCPFCGSEAKYKVFENILRESVNFTHCDECHIRTGDCFNLCESIDVWNTRTNPILDKCLAFVNRISKDPNCECGVGDCLYCDARELLKELGE